MSATPTGSGADAAPPATAGPESTPNPIPTRTPANDGFSMPGEFEPHRGCWMLWPERPDNWRLDAGPARDAYVAVAEAIHVSDPVTMAVSPRQFSNARARLSTGIRVIEIDSDDAWMRDVGPSFLAHPDGRRRAVNWQFNGWGGAHDGLYSSWDRDSRVATQVAEAEGLGPDDVYDAPFVLEGGSIHVDGEGTVVTTEECLLSPGRNPELSRGDIERLLEAYLGAEKTVWIPRGLVDDETNGHVDNILHVCAPGVVALHWCDDPEDPQREISLEALAALSGTRDARGRPFEVRTLPHPGPLFVSEDEAEGLVRVPGGMSRKPGDRLAASYANFYVGTRRIVYPLLDPATDAEAEDALRFLFPDRELVGIPAREILLGGGGIHCITQQVP